MHKHLAEPQEEDVSECQSDTYTDIPSDTSSSLLGRQGDSHYRKDESRERQGKPGILLDESLLDICISSHLLKLYQLIQF